MELRNYQERIVELGIEILKKYKILYLACETRTGKTSTALNIIKELYPDYSIVFATKKAVKSSATNDYKQWGITNPINIISIDSVHNLTYQPKTVYVIDEAHGIGAFPRPNLRARNLKQLVKDNPVIYLSGTPTPESFAQIYHQLYISNHSPFKEYKTFYKWHNSFGIYAKKFIGVGLQVMDYSKVRYDDIEPYIDPLRLSITKAEAGFKYSQITDQIITVPMDWICSDILKTLQNEGVYNDLNMQIVAENAGGLYCLHHQLCGGTVITENGEREIICKNKVNYINNNFKDQKIAIFYKFIAEEQLLRKCLKKNIVNTPEEFNSTDHNSTILYQYQSGSMGIDLSSADYIVAYNIDPSATTYNQFRDRMQSFTREKEPICIFLLSDLGLDMQIYKNLQKKKSYTLAHYKRKFKC